MPIPETFTALAESGYRHRGSGRCRYCGGWVEWFQTPHNRKIPMSLKVEIMVSEDAIFPKPNATRYEPHFAACRAAKAKRRS